MPAVVMGSQLILVSFNHDNTAVNIEYLIISQSDYSRFIKINHKLVNSINSK